jgi:ABC-type branched-subunit amino acid transport system substrate-binding protein
MKAIFKSIRILLLVSSLAGFSLHAHGAGKEVVIGVVVPLSGPLSTLGTPLLEGAAACIDLVNSRAEKNANGLNGLTLRLEKADDQFDPKLTVSETRRLIATYSPVALLNTAGSLQNIALVESGVLQKPNIALVGPRDGSAALRALKNPNLYFLIASVAAEADKMVHVSGTIGRKKLAVVYSDDADGRDALKEIQRAAKADGSTVVATYSVPANSKIIPEIAGKIAADNSIQLVLVHGVTPVVAQVYKEVRKLRSAMPVNAFSATSHAAIVDLLGPVDSRGLMLTQVTPPTSSALDVMKEFRDAMDLEQIPETRINNLHLEGFLAARVVIEALKRIRGTPSSESVIATLDQINKTNIGGISYDFSNGKREGSAFVQIGIIGPQGKLMN